MCTRGNIPSMEVYRLKYLAYGISCILLFWFFSSFHCNEILRILWKMYTGCPKITSNYLTHVFLESRHIIDKCIKFWLLAHKNTGTKNILSSDYSKKLFYTGKKCYLTFFVCLFVCLDSRNTCIKYLLVILGQPVFVLFVLCFTSKAHWTK